MSAENGYLLAVLKDTMLLLLGSFALVFLPCCKIKVSAQLWERVFGEYF